MVRAIKPCPYCGGETKVRRVGRWRLRFSVFCSRCDKSTIPGSAWKLTKLGAIKEWDSRLTYWCDNWHGGGKWFVAIDAEGREDYGPHVDRLAAYEETGLEPGEIEQLKGEVFGLRLDKQELEQYRALGPIDRLRELKQADDEGRCVVLPFKPPRWVYMCSARFPKPAKAHYASAINVLQDMDSGCVFGDTPKEAEDALRREQEKEKEDEHETS